MCGMCGLLQGAIHWSESGSDPAGARRRRLLQVALANRLLRLFRLRLDDFHGQSYVLSGPTGAVALVPDFGGVWPAAESLLGRPIDPFTISWPDTVEPTFTSR